MSEQYGVRACRRREVNLSIFYVGLPASERPSSSSASERLEAIEMWGPFSNPSPSDRELVRLIRSLGDAGTQLVCCNLDARDMVAENRELLSSTRANLEATLVFAALTGRPIVNARYGNREPGVDGSVQDGIAIERLCRVVEASAPRGITVLVESLNESDNRYYPLTTVEAAAELIAAVRAYTGTGQLRRRRHSSSTARRSKRSCDPPVTCRRHQPRPGRRRAGARRARHRRGGFPSLLRCPSEIEYGGTNRLEFRPQPGVDPFAWLSRTARSSTGSAKGADGP